MFKISQSSTFTYPVSVDVVGDNGKISKQNFTATFDRLSTTEVTEWVERISNAYREGNETAIAEARELAHKVVVGWSDIRDANNDEIPFSSTALSQILDIHPVPISIGSAWLEAVNGGAKRKN